MLATFRDGGPMMIPIAGCSFALLVFVFERFIMLRRGRVIPGPFVRRFLDHERAEAARAIDWLGEHTARKRGSEGDG